MEISRLLYGGGNGYANIANGGHQIFFEFSINLKAECIVQVVEF